MDKIEELKQLIRAAEPERFNTNSAGIKDIDECFECPFCEGEGAVQGNQYINMGGTACNVLFTGIGPEFKNLEAFYNASLEALPALIALVEEMEKFLKDIAAQGTHEESYRDGRLEFAPSDWERAQDEIIESIRLTPLPLIAAVQKFRRGE